MTDYFYKFFRLPKPFLLMSLIHKVFSANLQINNHDQELKYVGETKLIAFDHTSCFNHYILIVYS